MDSNTIRRNKRATETPAEKACRLLKRRTTKQSNKLPTSEDGQPNSTSTVTKRKYVRKAPLGHVETDIWEPSNPVTSNGVQDHVSSTHEMNQNKNAQTNSTMDTTATEPLPMIANKGSQQSYAPATTTNRGRGRPRGSRNATIKPNKRPAATSPTEPVPMPRPRGRPKGSKNKKQPCETNKGKEHAAVVDVPSCKPGRPKGSKSSNILPRKRPVETIPTELLHLPHAPKCEHCGAHGFYKEPPNFCCGGGKISLQLSEMPEDLVELFTGTDEASVQFRKEVRSYNNNLAFTSLGANYDRELVKNIKGVYTFKVNSQVYHYLHSLKPGEGKNPRGIQLYFYDSEEELKARLSQPHNRMAEETLSRLMDILKNNPYWKFLKDLRDEPNLDSKIIVLNTSPVLDQRKYNPPKSTEVAAIFTNTSSVAVDKSVHIQIYDKFNKKYRIKHFAGCYNTLMYPLLFPAGDTGWHNGIEKNPKKQKRSIGATPANSLPPDIDTAAKLVALENKGTSPMHFYFSIQYSTTETK
ncbi:OLC1v1025236C1 [Oldenlandia corymbosa var. corymbosa]|uniref:OLC1v1025236C1 n=1 Tax=Oldenlandia corymbosa var. corymbosa TaxID=529605 RepID=A0AAV1C727_OLDCO|nr:OLC1v1025236C1 [Oldenlandia corymbosa var. corymbosa]